jgi:hypothetical protein
VSMNAKRWPALHADRRSHAVRGASLLALQVATLRLVHRFLRSLPLIMLFTAAAGLLTMHGLDVHGTAPSTAQMIGVVDGGHGSATTTPLTEHGAHSISTPPPCSHSR